MAPRRSRAVVSHRGRGEQEPHWAWLVGSGPPLSGVLQQKHRYLQPTYMYIYNRIMDIYNIQLSATKVLISATEINIYNILVFITEIQISKTY